MKKLKLIDVYIITLIFGAIISVVLRSYALLFELDLITKQFSGSIHLIGDGIVLLAILFFCAYFFLKKEKEDLIEKNDNAASFIPAGIVSTAMLFMGVDLLRGMNDYSLSVLRNLSMWSAIFAFISIGSFFLSIFIEQKNDLYKSAFSICTVIFLALYACFLYFNKAEHPTNSPVKIVDQLAYLLSAAFFLYESRIPLGRAKWRGYVAFGLMAALMCYYSAIPSLVFYVSEGYVISESLIESVLTLTLAIFITSKVFQTKNLTPNTECETAKSIAALAALRQEEIEEMRRASHARANNNIEENVQEDDVANYTFDIPYVETRSEFSTDEGDDINA